MAHKLFVRQAQHPTPQIEATPVPAAQYVRMSTESQAYSIENQQITNHQWALLHGFEVVRTYADPGKSGVVLKNRMGLQALLNDVASGHAPFKAVLVYDVSRWGRFQDMDESAYYEFMCKSAAIPVYYCAEAFSIESTVPNLILKALKRTMAAEFSRDLGERTYTRQRRAAQNGFWMSSRPGYGLRRMLLDVNGKPKHQMKDGERKALQSDRIRIVLGPKHEVECVREIFKMVIRGKGKVGPKPISQELNRRGIKHFGKEWTDQHVIAILSNPKYCGTYVWGKLSRKLHGEVKKTPPSEWVVCETAIPAIVDKDTFRKAQEIRPRRPNSASCEELLRRCKAILAEKGNLSERTLLETKGAPSASTIYRHFQGMWNLYRKLNYEPEPTRLLRDVGRQCAGKLRDQVLNQIAASCPKHIDVIELAPGLRRMLLVDRVVPVSVLLCRPFQRIRRKGWIAMPHPRERDCATLLCLLDDTQNSVRFYFVGPAFPLCRSFVRFDTSEEWFKPFKRVSELSQFYWDIWEVQGEHPVSQPARPGKRYSNFITPSILENE